MIANAGISEEIVGLERDIVGATYALFSTNVDEAIANAALIFVSVRGWAA